MNHAKSAAIAVMAHMALIDGEVSPEEQEQLELWVSQAELPALLESVRNRPMAELVADVSAYEDKFFIALRAFAMAHEDQHFDDLEEASYLRLITALGIEAEDKKLIEKAVLAENRFELSEPDPRLERMYLKSCFVGGGIE